MAVVAPAWIDPFRADEASLQTIVDGRRTTTLPIVTAVDLHGRSFDEDVAATRGWTPAEAQRLRAFARSHDAHLHLTGRWTVKRLVGLACGVPADTVTFRTAPHGKPVPVLAGSTAPCDDLHVNVSHAGRYVMVAMHGTPVGIDVEIVSGSFDPVALATRFLSPDVARAVHEARPDARSRVFLRAWCELEARSKAVGIGLHVLGDDLDAAVTQAVDAATCHAVDLPSDVVGCVATSTECVHARSVA